MIDETQLKNIVKEILTHESVPRDAGISKEVQISYDALVSSGEQAVPYVVSALNECARGLITGMWWYGAEELCKLLSQIKAPSAKEALLTILKTDSKIVEFDRVRSLVVDLILCFKDPAVIPTLLEASKVPHAPILKINKAIEALGGTKSVTPETIILEGKNITDDVIALQYYAKYAVQVSGWSSNELQGGFYWWYGNRVEKLKGLKSALPYYAAAVFADHDSNAPAWEKFSGVSPSIQSARRLALKYPLSSSSTKIQAREVSYPRRGRILAVFGWIIAFVSIIMMMGGLGGYFFPDPAVMRKSAQITLAQLIGVMIVLGSLLFLGIWMIQKANKLRRLTSGSS